MNKRFTSLGLTAALVAGGAAGLAIGITHIAGASPQEPTVSAVADSASAPSAPTSAAVSTPPVADVETSDDDATDDDTTGDDSHQDHVGGDSHQDHGDGDQDRRGGLGGHGGEVDAAATALGMTPDEMFTALDSGQTIAALAQAKGIAPQTVIDAVVAAITAREQAEVASGDHTQAEVDVRLADLTTRVAAMVNGTPGDADGPRSHGPKSRGGHQDGDHEDGDGDG